MNREKEIKFHVSYTEKELIDIYNKWITGEMSDYEVYYEILGQYVEEYYYSYYKSLINEALTKGIDLND